MSLQTDPLYNNALIDSQPCPIRFPSLQESCDQDQEWCEVYMDAGWRRLRLHDYADIYQVPGLYEHLFVDLLRCCSPRQVVRLLGEVLRDWPQSATDLSVIDLGAGNGMVGAELRALGVRALVGTDILPEAAEAASRDRPELYDDYVVADLCDPQPSQVRRLRQHDPNCLTTVAALGFGDIPPQAFANAFNLISTPGWLAFNIKERFLDGHDDSGFSRLMRYMTESGIVQIQAYRRYSHRLSIAGRRLHYVAMVARKLRPLPRVLPHELS
jgi:predicted TPR repeat methyltransferase